jgi:hypothetical protein
MTDTPLSMTEIEEQIAVVRENLRQLVEQAAAYSGSADEELMAERIAGQETQLQILTDMRNKLLR